jgi:hypothetical protein
MNRVRNRSSGSAWNFDSYAFLAFILTAGPLAWLLSLFVKFVLASKACLRPSEFTGRFPPQGVYVIIDVVAIVVVCIAAWLSYREAHATAARSWDKFHHVTDVGEAREHFLALWALLISALFISAIIFGFVADVTVSPCAF